MKRRFLLTLEINALVPVSHRSIYVLRHATLMSSENEALFRDLEVHCVTKPVSKRILNKCSCCCMIVLLRIFGHWRKALLFGYMYLNSLS